MKYKTLRENKDIGQRKIERRDFNHNVQDDFQKPVISNMKRWWEDAREIEK